MAIPHSSNPRNLITRLLVERQKSNIVKRRISPRMIVIGGFAIVWIIYIVLKRQQHVPAGAPMEILRTALTKLESQLPPRSSSLTKQTVPKLPLLITFVTHIDSLSPYCHFCDALHAALRQNWDIHVLGFGKDGGRWGWGDQKYKKVPTLLQFLKTLPHDQPFVFIDGFDVLVQGSPSHALQVYQQFAKNNQLDTNTILFGAEPNCWPFGLEADRYPQYVQDICQRIYPSSPTKYRWLNSGVWMAYPQAAIRLLEGEKLIRDIPGLLLNQVGDQVLAQYAFLSQKFGIQLDTHAKFAQSMHELHAGDLVLDTSNQKWRNTLTQQTPLSMHFNGGGKDLWKEYADMVISPFQPTPVSDYSKLLQDKDLLKTKLHGIDFENVCKS